MTPIIKCNFPFQFQFLKLQILIPQTYLTTTKIWSKSLFPEKRSCSSDIKKLSCYPLHQHNCPQCLWDQRMLWSCSSNFWKAAMELLHMFSEIPRLFRKIGTTMSWCFLRHSSPSLYSIKWLSYLFCLHFLANS